MVTANFAKGLTVTLAAIGGMFIGFHLQNDSILKTEKRINDRVNNEVDRILIRREKELQQRLEKVQSAADPTPN